MRKKLLKELNAVLETLSSAAEQLGTENFTAQELELDQAADLVESCRDSLVSLG